MAIALKRVKIVAVLLIIGMTVLPFSVALANSMPRVELWLEFEYETSELPELEAVQIIRCDTAECRKLTLLQQHGTCDVPGCLHSSPALEASQPLMCAGNRCVVVFWGDDALPPFRVVGRFSDRVRLSNLISDGLPQWGTYVWEITVQEIGLAVVAADRDPSPPSAPFSRSFLGSFALTIAVELLVAAGALRGWLKLKDRDLLRGLGYVLFANLISYPVTWAFWPSLRRLQPMEMRQIGYFLVFVALVFTAVLVALSRKEGKARRGWITFTIVLVPVAAVATLLFGLFAGMNIAYGGAPIAVPGLPSGLTIALAEVFAVSFEALVLYLLARKTLELALKQAAAISLFMNAASFLLGWALSSWL